MLRLTARKLQGKNMTAATMPTSRANQWGGLAFMLGNMLFLVNKFDEMSRLFLRRWMPDVISGENPALILVGQVALILGYVTFYQFYSRRLEGPDKHAIRLFSGGGIVLAFSHVGFLSVLADFIPSSMRPYVEGLFLLLILGLLLLIIGLIWFGILNARRPVSNGWRWLPLATGLMGFIGFFLFSGEEITAIFLVFRTLFALGLIGLGATLALEKPFS
jgi:hypothetical protein